MPQPRADFVERHHAAFEQPGGEFPAQIVEVQILDLGRRTDAAPLIAEVLSRFPNLVAEYVRVRSVLHQLLNFSASTR